MIVVDVVVYVTRISSLTQKRTEAYKRGHRPAEQTKSVSKVNIFGNNNVLDRILYCRVEN